MTEEISAELAIERLLGVLDLEEIDVNIYRGQNEPDRPGRLFGGQVAAQSLAAAGRTVENVPAHSLHGYFLRPGDPDVPVVYSVDRIRDGRSFTTRRVVAQQHGKAIFNMAVSYHAAEHGYSHQFPMPEVPDPENLMGRAEYAEKYSDRIPKEFLGWAQRRGPIDTRYGRAPSFVPSEPQEGPGVVWLRAAAALPEDPMLHQCVLTYATDISLIDSIVQPHGRMGAFGPLMTASLDHAVWFHKPVLADEWLLYYQDSPSAFGARGLARGTIYTQRGELVASTAQEALIRPATAAEDRSE
ncbi:MAG: acyl-CoA thioesterase II [Myxococcota bacterium]|nr:acyl-CoA thioesterase II [Myxococcota bacterium]